MATYFNGICPVCKNEDCGTAIAPWVVLCDICDCYHDGKEKYSDEELEHALDEYEMVT